MQRAAMPCKGPAPDMGGQAPGDVEKRFCMVGVAEAQGGPVM